MRRLRVRRLGGVMLDWSLCRLGFFSLLACLRSCLACCLDLYTLGGTEFA